MTTRAVYTVKDAEGDKFAVYCHYDGYPEGAAAFIDKAREFAFPGARFQAMDFAAALIAANKTPGGGGVYCTKGHLAHADLDYDYVISHRHGSVNVTAYRYEWNTKQGGSRVKFFSGSLHAFVSQYAEKKEVA